MYVTDPAHDTKDIDSLREAVKSSKGPGNFRNLFLYAPNGDAGDSAFRSGRAR